MYRPYSSLQRTTLIFASFHRLNLGTHHIPRAEDSRQFIISRALASSHPNIVFALPTAHTLTNIATSSVLLSSSFLPLSPSSRLFFLADAPPSSLLPPTAPFNFNDCSSLPSLSLNTLFYSPQPNTSRSLRRRRVHGIAERDSAAASCPGIARRALESR